VCKAANDRSGGTGLSFQTVAVLAVGDELLGGYTIETNGAAIAETLAEFGLEVAELRVLRDTQSHIASALTELSKSYRFVFMTGGLGPTLDDVSRHAAAEAAGVELELSEVALEEVRAWWTGRDQEMPDSNERQALMPVGATHIVNTAGTAPGFRLDLKDSTIVALPGPPRELRRMLTEGVLPWLRTQITELELVTAHFYLFGLSESIFAEKVGAWMERDANPLVGVTASRGVLTVRVRAAAKDGRSAQDLIDEFSQAFRERFEEHLFSETDPTLEVALAKALFERQRTISFAESCTGGQAAANLCRVPGVSEVFNDGFVTYSNDAKVRRLGVAPELIEEFGAVSEEVAKAMAEGARLMSGSDLAVSVTGIAGPGGGSAEKPVGLVWFAIATQDGTEAHARRFPAFSRDWIRDSAARTALHLAWSWLTNDANDSSESK
jgi:nicotinamide-nucleotide amidase